LLCFSDPDSTVPALTNFLARSPQPEIRRLATDALAKHGQDARVAVPFLLSRSGDSDSEIRVEATNALMQIAPEVLSPGHLRLSQPP
jgi:HEAT repeat protein